MVAVLCFIFLVDFPDQGHKAWGFLNERETAFIIRRLNRDRGDANVEPFTMGRFFRPALDLKVWGFGMIFLYGTHFSVQLFEVWLLIGFLFKLLDDS